MLGIKREYTAARYTIFITELCNWNCDYCDIPARFNKRDGDITLLKKYLPVINNHNVEMFTLTGGEPALSSHIEYFFDTVSQKIKVNTNGTFLETGGFDRWYDRISHIGYHAVKHPGDTLPENKMVYDKKTTIYIPFDNHNWHLIPDMVDRYPDVRFNFIPYVGKKLNVDVSRFVSVDNILKLQIMLRGYGNIDYGIFDNYIINDDTINHHRNFCKNSNTRYLFDFVDGFIYRCPQSRLHNRRVEMNDENVEKAGDMTLFRETDVLDGACEDCYYFTLYMKYGIRNRILKNAS